MAVIKRSKKRLNSWFYTAFAFFAFAFIAVPTMKHIGDENGLSSYGALIIFGAAAGFAGFATTGAIKQGEFVQRFYTASRKDTPISFWFCAISGYVVTSGFIALFILELIRNR